MAPQPQVMIADRALCHDITAKDQCLIVILQSRNDPLDHGGTKRAAENLREFRTLYASAVVRMARAV